MADKQSGEAFRCGYVAIVGRPNVGKSTLLNKFIGQKVSIVTHKAQTTRHQILGIKTADNYQLIYVDTPGVHKDIKHALNKSMNKSAFAALQDVDAILFVCESGKWKPEDQLIVDEIAKKKVPAIAVINKVDLVRDKKKLLPFIEKLSKKHEFNTIVPASAVIGSGLQDLETELLKYMPAGHAFFAEDDITDKSLRFQVAELIREQLYLQLQQELPYAVTVQIEAFEEGEDLDRIAATIWVAKASNKSIVIGKSGATLKSVGTLARKQMEAALNKKVHLDLWVKVKAGWSDDEKALQSLGY